MPTNPNDIPNPKMGDIDLINDSIASQKLITDTYNTYANECATPNLRDDFMNILKDEHQIQYELFTEMQKRGWYQVKPAEQNMIMQAKQKYQNILG